MLLLALMLAAVASPALARKRASAPTPVQQLTKAKSAVDKIPQRLYARGRRVGLERIAAVALRASGKKNACLALRAADAVVNGLGTPSTWKSGKVPARFIRVALSLVNKAMKTLQRKAGSKCAKPARVRALKPQRGGSGAPKTPSPPDPSAQGEGLNHPLASGPFHPVKKIGGASALGPDLHGATPDRRRGFSATDPLTFFRSADIGVPPRQICCPEEVNAAIGGNVAWYTGNGSVGLSTNAGRTWTLFDPSNVLPDQGLGFCCDQLVSYSPTYHMFVWVMQYWCNESCLRQPGNHCQTNGAFNRIRIAVATPGDLIAHASNPGLAWSYWDITPQMIGQPSNAWFDRSDSSVNPYNLNWNVDVLCGNAGSLLGRISLAQLAARGTVSLGYITPGGRMTSAQGLGSLTTYFAGNTSLSQSRIWSWAPFSGTLFAHDVHHTSIPTFDNAIIGSNSGNWYDRYGIFPGEVESSTVSGNTIYLAQGSGRAYCTANCSTNSPVLNHVFDQDAVLITKYNLSTWSETGERWLWNPTLAFGWPALQTDGAGDVGIALRTSAANHNAQPVAGFLSPSEQFVYALPEGLPHEAGDYYSLRPGRTSQSFVMTGQTVQNDSGTPTMHWNYIEYGHGASPYVAPPNVRITAPANLSSFTQGATVTYSASVSDPVDGTLPNAAIRWTEGRTLIGTGPNLTRTENVLGRHTLTVTATNGDGKSASASITVTVTAAPSVAISAPPNGTVFCSALIPGTRTFAGTVPIQASATDPNNPPQTLSFSWSDSIDGGAAQQLAATALSPTLQLVYRSPDNQTTHLLTLTATNTSGQSTSAQLTVGVAAPGSKNCR